MLKLTLFYRGHTGAGSHISAIEGKNLAFWAESKNQLQWLTVINDGTFTTV